LLIFVSCRFWADAVLQFALSVGETKELARWNFLAETYAEARSAQAGLAGNQIFAEWLCLLDKLRTFFQENPETEI